MDYPFIHDEQPMNFNTHEDPRHCWLAKSVQSSHHIPTLSNHDEICFGQNSAHKFTLIQAAHQSFNLTAASLD